MMDEIVQFKLDLAEDEKYFSSDSDNDLEHFVRQWERDFDHANPDPMNNSDFDSDNEVNPVDNINQVTGNQVISGNF